MASTRQQRPRSVDWVIPRPTLAERLSATPVGGVALVCAPAGSGKTALLRSWATAQADPVAWVAVDRGEHDAQRFWLHVIDALADAAGDNTIERVSPAPSFAGAAVVERLLDQLSGLEAPIWLVADDLHELDSDDAFTWLELLLAHLPPHLRVVLATREDPALGLHRLRLAGELVELRAPELRFSLDDTRALLSASAITLSDGAISSLQERTEGWPAGVRMAAMSLASHPDPERFVDEFSGSERTVAGYLLAEVLEHQPPEVRDLLLRTSILERVSGSLADALTGGSGAEAILQRLEHQNAFVSSIDAARTWFRYHHLFADLLALELRRLAPETIPSLHRAAAVWFERHGEILAAVRHAHAAADWAHGGRLLVDNYLTLTMEGRTETIHALLGEIPPDVPRGNADVAAVLAIDTTLHGSFDEAQAQLATARQLGAAAPPERRAVFDVYAAVIGLELARRRNDLAAARDQMRALETTLDTPGAAPVRPDYRALALMNLGIAEVWSGDPASAREHLDDSLALTQRISQPFIEVGCLAHLAIAAPLTAQSLRLALDLSERAIAIAEEHGWTTQPIAAGAFAVAGTVLGRMGRFAEADAQLDRGAEALRAGAEPGTEILAHYARAMCRFGGGRLDEALREFARAQAITRLLADEHTLTLDVRSRVIQVRVRMGDTDSAAQALAALEPEDRARAGARIAEAALELANDQPERAAAVLAPVIDAAAVALVAVWARAEALLLDALACDRLGDRGGCERALEASLDITEPDGLILPYMIWPCREILERHPKHRTAHAALIATILDTVAGGDAGSGGAAEPLRDQLSEAELRVVRYLPSNLSATEIANQLFVSANTVRTHMRHIYSKLDAHTRSEAVARARELGLLAPGAARR